MGGQACVLYGGAQFSKDTDIHLTTSSESLSALQTTLAEFHAQVIAVPPFEVQYLQQGLAIHFRCFLPDGSEQRLDVMSVMRRAAPFEELWRRRTTFELDQETIIDVIAIEDLVRIKKTRRDKDWPMIRQLLESHYANYRSQATPEQIMFWLNEARTPELLSEVAQTYPEQAKSLTTERPLLIHALKLEMDHLRTAILNEEIAERQRDQQYWAPLLKELEQLRIAARNKPQ